MGIKYFFPQYTVSFIRLEILTGCFHFLTFVWLCSFDLRGIPAWGESAGLALCLSQDHRWADRLFSLNRDSIQSPGQWADFPLEPFTSVNTLNLEASNPCKKDASLVTISKYIQKWNLELKYLINNRYFTRTHSSEYIKLIF